MSSKRIHFLGKLIMILLAANLIAACFVAASNTPVAPEPFSAMLSDQLKPVKTVLSGEPEEYLAGVLPPLDSSGLDSSNLEKNDPETLRNKIIQTDYLDENGVLTFASNLSYASVIKAYDSNGFCIREMYFDENRNPMRKSNGCYGLAFENNEEGLPVKLIYLDADGNPVTNTSGYAVLCRTYNEEGKPLKDTYFDSDMQQIKRNGYYMFEREYDDKGNVVLQRYLDQDENPVKNSSGYAFCEKSFDEEGHTISEKYFNTDRKPVCSTSKFAEIERQYFTEEKKITEHYYNENGSPVLSISGYAGIEKIQDSDGHTVYEKYFGTDGKPAASIYGNAAQKNIYNDLGQRTEVYYLDENDDPMITAHGYAGIKYTYNRDGSILEEYYFDENGSPMKVKGDYYGIRHDGGDTIFLDADGKPLFLPDHFLRQNPWVSFALMIAICLICFVLPKSARIVLCILYAGFILYMTLFTREAGAGGWNFDVAGSYSRFFLNESTRTEMLENIALFIPFGLLLRSCWKSGWTILVGAVYSIVIEFIQGFTGLGGFEVNDIINNSLGMVIGVLIVMIGEAIAGKKRRAFNF